MLKSQTSSACAPSFLSIYPFISHFRFSRSIFFVFPFPSFLVSLMDSSPPPPDGRSGPLSAARRRRALQREQVYGEMLEGERQDIENTLSQEFVEELDLGIQFSQQMLRPSEHKEFFSVLLQSILGDQLARRRKLDLVFARVSDRQLGSSGMDLDVSGSQSTLGEADERALVHLRHAFSVLMDTCSGEKDFVFVYLIVKLLYEDIVPNGKCLQFLDIMKKEFGEKQRAENETEESMSSEVGEVGEVGEVDDSLSNISLPPIFELVLTTPLLLNLSKYFGIIIHLP